MLVEFAPNALASIEWVEPDQERALALARCLATEGSSDSGTSTPKGPALEVQLLGPTASLDTIDILRPSLVLFEPSDVDRPARALARGAADVAPFPLARDDLLLRLRVLAARESTRSELSLVSQDFEALLELSGSLSTNHDITHTLLEICERLVKVMHAGRCSIVLLDDEARDGFVVAASDDASLKSHKIEIDGYPEIREVIRTAAPLVIADVHREPLFEPVRDKLKDKPLGSTMVFPVLIDRRVQGVVMLRDHRVRPHGLTPREVRFGRIVANATASAIKNARVYETIRDTSERRLSERLKVERRLRQIEKYQRFFDFAGDGLIIVDAGGRILFANRAARAILGFDAPAINQITLHDIVTPGARPVLEGLMQRISAGIHSTGRDLPVVRASGEEAILSLTTAALEDNATGDLQPQREKDETAIVSFRDVTETRRIQDELRRTKDFLANVIESSADAIVATDMEGRIIIFNKVAERITEIPASRALGSPVAALYPTGVAQEIMADLRSSKFGGVGRIQDRRQSLLSRTGELIPIILAASIVYDGGREVATVSIFSDLRERQRIEQQLVKAQEQLELSERQSAVVELAGAVAHELNQPLTSIVGTADLMARKLPPDSPLSSSVKTIISEAERMAEMVRKLGQITRYETKPYVGVTTILDLDAASKGGGPR